MTLAMVDAEQQSLRAELLSDADDLLGWLASGYAIARDTQFQAILRQRAGVARSAPLLIALPETGAWIRLKRGGGVEVQRAPTPGLPEYRFEIEGDAALRAELAAAIQRSQATAWATQRLTPLFDTAGSPTREEFADLAHWSPVLEKIAYRYYAKTIALLEHMRPPVQAGGGRLDEDVIAYWSGLHVAGHLSLIASSPEAGGWLGEIAALSEGSAWTPSLPLVRERTLWLAAVGAKAAAAFGASAIPLYAAALGRADQPVTIFDALLGLTAIALAHPSAARAAQATIRSARLAVREPSATALAHAMSQAALSTIESASAARRSAEAASTSRNPDVEFLNSLSLNLDPMKVLPSGRPFAFSALPALIRTDASQWYPSRGRADLRLPPAEIEALLARAWGRERTASERTWVH